MKLSKRKRTGLYIAIDATITDARIEIQKLLLSRNLGKENEQVQSILFSATRTVMDRAVDELET
jgi:hypothetical protein